MPHVLFGKKKGYFVERNLSLFQWISSKIDQYGSNNRLVAKFRDTRLTDCPKNYFSHVLYQGTFSFVLTMHYEQPKCLEFCDPTSDPCTHRSGEYVLIVVCSLTGYVIAVPCQNTPTPEDLDLERVVQSATLPQTTSTEHYYLIIDTFFRTLCNQAGLDAKKEA